MILKRFLIVVFIFTLSSIVSAQTKVHSISTAWSKKDSANAIKLRRKFLFYPKKYKGTKIRWRACVNSLTYGNIRVKLYSDEQLIYDESRGVFDADFGESQLTTTIGDPDTSAFRKLGFGEFHLNDWIVISGVFSGELLDEGLCPKIICNDIINEGQREQ